jgi:PKD repeat protein
MRKLLMFFSMMIVAGFMALSFTSCDSGGDEPEPAPVPTVQILADLDPDDGYTVNLTVQATNQSSLAWDYGDGNVSSETGNHSYTYSASGDYAISVVATGEGGTDSDSKSVTIAASIEEIIAGAGDDGKTWVLTQADGAGKMGVGHVDNSLDIIEGMDIIPANVLSLFGLGDEYPDEFTFFKDGSFAIDTKNGKGLASALYGGLLLQTGMETDVTMSESINDLPLSIVPFASVTEATWSLSYAGFTTMAQNEIGIDGGDQVLEEKNFSFTEGETRTELVLSTGAYIGFYDLTYPEIPGVLPAAVDNSFYIIKEVTPDGMHIAVASCGLGDLLIYPTYMLHLTFVPK